MGEALSRVSNDIGCLLIVPEAGELRADRESSALPAGDAIGRRVRAADRVRHSRGERAAGAGDGAFDARLPGV